MMTPGMSQASKLQALRSQTDRELLALINSYLQRGFGAAGRMEFGSEAWLTEVSLMCAEVARLLPVVGPLSRQEHARIEARLAELEAMVQFRTMRAAS